MESTIFRHTKIEIIPICKNGSHRLGVKAECTFWMDGSKMKMFASQYGKTEGEARSKLMSFLSSQGLYQTIEESN